MNVYYYEYQGKTVTTTDISKICGRNVKWVRKAVYRYKTIEELIEAGKKSKNKKRYVYNGVNHNVKELLPYSKVPYITLRHRLALGWSIERALNEGVKNDRN